MNNENDLKTCKECKKEKPFNDFEKHKSYPDGLRNICKECQEYLKENTLKICPGCNKEKPLTEFNKFGTFRNGLLGKCEDCQEHLKEEHLEKKKLCMEQWEIEKNERKVAHRLKYFNKFKDHVEKRHGQLLSLADEYKDAHSKLKVKCNNNHEFETTLNNINHNEWCPTCKIKLGEHISIKAIEHLFGKKFVKVRPDWLRNDEDNKLELDGYNEELKLSIEYQGRQHFEQVPFFQKTNEEFKKRERDDESKIDSCQKQGVNLIVIPYTIKHQDLCNFIATECTKLGYNILNKVEDFNVSECINNIASKVETLNALITSKGGEWIDGDYIDRNSDIKIRCNKGHEWSSKVGYIIGGSWCHQCAHVQTEERREKIGEGLKKYYNTEEGIKTKKKLIIKRSKTMQQQREELRKTITHKECGHCNIIKPVSEFNKKADAKDCLQTNCRTCVCEIKRQWRQKGQTN